MYEFLTYRVADVMTYRPVTVGRRTPLAEVERLFEQHGFDALPVVEDGGLVGVVSKLDFLRAFAFTAETMVPRYAEIMARPAETVMSTRPVTVRPEAPLTRVLQLMVETGFKSLPVVIGSLLIGIVARQDLTRALRRAASGESAGRSPSRPAEGASNGRCALHS